MAPVADETPFPTSIMKRLKDAGWEDELKAQVLYKPYNQLLFLTETKHFKDVRPVTDRSKFSEVFR